jgi:hypothetical protein
MSMPSVPLASLTEEWWRTWRRANEIGWAYFNAVSGLMRLNIDALTRASRVATSDLR